MRRTLEIGIATVLLAAAPAAAETAAGDREVAAELARLNRNVEGLVELVRAAVERQRQEILLRRLEIARSELAPLQEERRRAVDSSESIARKRDQLRAERDALVEGAPNDEERTNLRRRFEMIETELDQELESLRRRLGELDAERAPIEKKIDRFEALLDDAIDRE